MKLARRVLDAVADHKVKEPFTGKSGDIPHPVHDVEKGVTGLNAARDEPLPDGICKNERLTRLSQALSPFIRDQSQERIQSEETVWDVINFISVDFKY